MVLSNNHRYIFLVLGMLCGVSQCSDIKNIVFSRPDRVRGQWLYVIRRHDLTSKKTNTKINTITRTNTLREHLQKVIQETCDLRDIL